jgi:hypothetical protein
MVDSQHNKVLRLSAGPGFEGLFLLSLTPLIKKNDDNRSYIHCFRHQFKLACIDPLCTLAGGVIHLSN